MYSLDVRVVNRVTISLLVIVMMLGVSYGMHAHTLSIFAKNDVGATYDELGTIGIAKFLPYVLIPLFIGVLLNRMNNGYILAIGVAMHAIPLFMMSMAETIIEIVLYQFAIGAAHAFIWPPVNSIFSTKPRTRVKNIAKAVMFFLLGLMIGPLMGIIIVDATNEDYRLLFQISSVVMSTSMITIMFLYSRLPKVKTIPVDIKSFGMILHFPVVVAVVLFTTAVSGILFVIYPAFLNDHGISASSVLLLYFIYGAIRVGSMILVNYMHKWMMPILTLCIVMMTVGLAISLFATSFVHFAVAISLMSLGIVAYPICLEVILSRTKRSIANKMVGAYASLIGAGWFLGPAIAGFTSHWYGVDTPYWLFLIAGAVMSIATLTMRKELAGVEAKYKHAIFTNHMLKNHFNVILLHAGLMNNALMKAKSYEDISPKMRQGYENMDRTLAEVDEMSATQTVMADPTLAEEIHDLVSVIKNTDITTGVGKGYPNYAEIKKGINECVIHLDEAVTVDVMLDVRHWVFGRIHNTDRR